MTRKKIMVVEDDDNIRSTLKEVFELEGYPVTVAENGRVAIDHLRASAHADLPSLILLDLMMPVLDGRGFLRERTLLESPASQVPVVVVSAAKEQLPAEVSVASFMKKPLELSQLLAVAEQYCG